MARNKLRDWLPGWNFAEYLLLRGAAALINALPIELSVWVIHGVARFLFWLFPKRKKTALDNLTIAYGNSISMKEKEAIAGRSLRSLVSSLLEFFRIPSMLREARSRFDFEGTEHLDRAFAKGKGVVFVISHLGSWEYLAFLPYLRGYPCSVIVRETKNPYIYKWIQQLRTETKLNPIDRKNSVRQILRELKSNHLVAILIDQWAGQEGLWMDFFSKPTSTTSIPARLGQRTGAALIPGYCLRTPGGRYRIVIRPEVPFEEGDDEHSMTLKLNRLLEQEILKYPGQWTWAHRRWKSKQRHSATP